MDGNSAVDSRPQEISLMLQVEWRWGHYLPQAIRNPRWAHQESVSLKPLILSKQQNTSSYKNGMQTSTAYLDSWGRRREQSTNRFIYGACQLRSQRIRKPSRHKQMSMLEVLSKCIGEPSSNIVSTPIIFYQNTNDFFDFNTINRNTELTATDLSKPLN